MIDIKQFEGKTIAPRDDALLYDFMISQNGIFEGCAVTSLGANQLRIASGRGLIMGRVFVVEDEIVLASLSSSGTRQGRLLIRVDVSNTERPIELATQVAAALPPLVREDINRDGSVFELPLATYSVNEIQISNLVAIDNRIKNPRISIDPPVSTVLSASGWQGVVAFTQSVTVPGMTPDASGFLTLSQSATAAQAQAARDALIRVTGQGTNTLTVTADGDKPTVDIPVTITIVG